MSGDEKGLIMMGSLTENMRKACQRPSRWGLESSAYLSPGIFTKYSAASS